MYPSWSEDAMPFDHRAMGRPLMMFPSGGFPVPGAIAPEDLPPSVKAAINRIIAGPPKPAVTPAVMEIAECSMIGPDLPFKADVRGM